MGAAVDDFGGFINHVRKYVVSSTLPDPTWTNTSVVRAALPRGVDVPVAPGQLVDVQERRAAPGLRAGLSRSLSGPSSPCTSSSL